ncbi:Hypothetical protein D9617_2g060210 [Elsinoe fawcettii]|nr:Hypothetical protein D9617_2g060210 [Elsinoe fawcettii]
MTATTIPFLKATENSKQLYVHGKPFLMRPGELQNSSLSSAEYMATVWSKLKAMSLNTALGSVTWEMIEPQEGQFSFDELDKVIQGAREHDMKLILLWFGSFKNGQSTYAPSWVKIDGKRFPRAKLRKAGGVLETADVVSLFHENAVAADIKAFTALMRHLKEFDGKENTVIMVQVENETGLLGDSRDGSEAANKVFSKDVPADLLEFLAKDYDALHEDLKTFLPDTTTLQERTKAPKHSWQDVFGVSSRTDELFMAYHYSLYLDRVASAGKAEYPLPLYTNVWQNYAGDDGANAFPTVAGGGGTPGDYPSGGGVSNVIDIWQHFAPHLDFIAPDIYLNDYASSCARYRHRNQPLFIPEQRRDEYGARRIWTAYASYGALGASPFGIDTLQPETSPWTKHFGLLAQVEALILEAQRRPGSSAGFFFDEVSPEGKADKPILLEMGGYHVSIERCFVFGEAGPGSGMIIHLPSSETAGAVARFLLIGWGFQAVFKSTKQDRFTGILGMKEKRVVDVETGELETLRTLGGDETRSGLFAMMPNEDPDYGSFPIAVTIPARTAIAEVEVYTLEE